jgi:hypothetical protein
LGDFYVKAPVFGESAPGQEVEANRKLLQELNLSLHNGFSPTLALVAGGRWPPC